MSDEFTTIKIWAKTRRLLRKIAATTDETLVEVMERLASAEWTRLERQVEDALPNKDS